MIEINRAHLMAVTLALVVPAAAVAQVDSGPQEPPPSPDPFALPHETDPEPRPPIKAIHEVLQPRDTLNLPVRLGERVRVRGVITSAPRPLGRGATIADFQDVTGGLPLFADDTVMLRGLVPGDSVEATGVLAHHDGMEELRIDRIRRLGRTAVPAPIPVTAEALRSEEFAGRLVEVSGRVQMSRGDAGTLRIVDETGSIPIYVRRPYLDDEAFARALFDAQRAAIVGIAAQQDLEPPYDDGYDVLPRSPDDYTLVTPPPYLTWIAWTVITLLVMLAMYAWHRRLRAEKQVDVLDRLTHDLERREAILSAVAFAGAHFLEEEEMDLPPVLERLAEAAPADGCAVLRMDETPPDVPDAVDVLAAGSDATDATDALRRFWAHVPRAEAWGDRLADGHLVEGRVDGHDLLLVPVFTEGELWGALTFFAPADDVEWSDAEIDALKAAAAMIGAAVSRRTTLRALEERDEQLRQAQKMEAIGRLAGGIAHDFNNLLTAVGGNASLLGAEADLNPEEHVLIDEIVDNVERGSTLARHLLAFSRRQALPSETADACVIVGGMVPMLRRLLGEDIELETTLVDGVWVRLPPGHLEQVVMNLAVNARDAMPDGGRLSVDVTHDQGPDGPRALVEIRDTGRGMDPETVANVFDPFFSTKADGSGLGLSIVYGIVTQADGEIDIDTEPGSGTRVTVRLPLCDAPALETPAADVATDPAEATGTILLVEDEPAVRSLARRVLDREGYTVLEAESGDAAIDTLEGHDGAVDLLLTDVRMPGMSGAELADRMAADGYRCPVLYMSGYAAEELELGDIESGSYLPKPFTPAELAEHVAAVLAARGESVGHERAHRG